MKDRIADNCKQFVSRNDCRKTIVADQFTDRRFHIGDGTTSNKTINRGHAELQTDDAIPEAEWTGCESDCVVALERVEQRERQKLFGNAGCIRHELVNGSRNGGELLEAFSQC